MSTPDCSDNAAKLAVFKAATDEFRGHLSRLGFYQFETTGFMLRFGGCDHPSLSTAVAELQKSRES